MNSAPNTVARHVVSALEAEGVEHVFGMPGSHVLALYDALADSKLRFVSASHENTSTFMAGMYGFLKGKAGVALLTAGPGATNSVSAVAQAFASSLPLVHITGDVPLRAGPEAFHGVDRPDFLHRLFADITKSSQRLERPEQVGDALARAFALAQSGRPGPVHLDIPIDLSSARLPEEHTSKYVPHAVVAREPDPGFVDAVCTSLARARRPVLCVCRGVLLHRAEEELLALAESLGAPVLSTAYALGAFPQQHALALGSFSEFSQNAFAFQVIQSSDYLLVLGLRPGTDMARMLAGVAPRDSAFVAFDEAEQLAAPTWPGPQSTCHLKSLLGRLLSRQAEFARSPDPELVSAIDRQNSAFRRGLGLLLEPHRAQRPLHFGLVMQALGAQLAPDAIVVSGVGNHHVWARNLLPLQRRESFVAESSWGTMGGELGGGLAAKLVHPQRQVIVVTGDASLLMVAGDLLTAVKEQLNILVIVLNDSRHGIIRGMQRQAFGRSFGDEIAETSFAKLGESMGLATRRLELSQDIGTALSESLAVSRERPTILDVVCDFGVPWPKRDALIQAGLERAGSKA